MHLGTKGFQLEVLFGIRQKSQTMFSLNTWKSQDQMQPIELYNGGKTTSQVLLSTMSSKTTACKRYSSQVLSTYFTQHFYSKQHTLLLVLHQFSVSFFTTKIILQCAFSGIKILGPLLGAETLWFDSLKRPPPVSLDLHILAGCFNTGIIIIFMLLFLTFALCSHKC